jgi:thiol-disulfide isomerase/thioredoxin
MLSFCETKPEVSAERLQVLADTIGQDIEYDAWMDLAYELSQNYPQEYVAGMTMVKATERSIMEQDAERFDKFFGLLKVYPDSGVLEMADEIAVANQFALLMSNEQLLQAKAPEVIEFAINRFRANEVGLQWRNELGTMIFSTRASIYELAGDNEKALEDYNSALEYYEQPETLMRRGLLLEAKGDLSAALEDFIGALRHAPDQPMIINKVKETYNALNPSDDADVFLKDLKDSLSESRREEVMAEMFSMAAPSFEFTDLSGKKINNANMLGKVVFVDFWATWCQPCRRELPEFQAFYEQHKKNPKVAFIAASTDSDRSKVSPFIKELRFTFPVAFANENATKFGVEGIPSLFIIGPSGNIRYKVVGFDPDKDFVREMNWRLESLLDG